MGWSLLRRFWLGLLLFAAAGAGLLQILGPPVRTAAAPASVAAAAPPARPAPVTIGPAPALALTAAAIQPDPGLTEPAPDFPGAMLPRIGAGGRAPMRAFAAAWDGAERHPRVALLIQGLGLDHALGWQAMRDLPPAIDFAFSAYAPPAEAAPLAQAGLARGRECLVSIPMEPSLYPRNDEGPRSLLTTADPAVNQRDLEWALSRLPGCVGATGASDGMAGERYAQSADGFAALLEELARRGLLYVDPRPGVVTGAGARSVTVSVADGDAATIDASLQALSQAAATHGSALGLAGPLTPVLLQRIEIWAQALPARGLVLAPVTALPEPAAVTADLRD